MRLHSKHAHAYFLFLGHPSWLTTSTTCPTLYLNPIRTLTLRACQAFSPSDYCTNSHSENHIVKLTCHSPILENFWTKNWYWDYRYFEHLKKKLWEMLQLSKQKLSCKFNHMLRLLTIHMNREPHVWYGSLGHMARHAHSGIATPGHSRARPALRILCIILSIWETNYDITFSDTNLNINDNTNTSRILTLVSFAEF